MYDVYIMIRTQVYIPVQLHQQARLIAQLENSSLSELIRQGLSKLVSKKQQKKDPLAHLEGKFRGGDKTAAINHDDIYKL